MRQQWFTHVRLLIAHPPRYSETSTAALTTPALDRRSLRWFGVSACTATPEDLPPSLAQHGSCRRSSTSSSLPFRTHVGAHNSVVGADQGFRAPSGDQESVRDSGHEDSASAPIAAGQRPRPSFRHPQASPTNTEEPPNQPATRFRAPTRGDEPGWLGVSDQRHLSPGGGRMPARRQRP